jgi:2OG-Fe(II) oxygenase superfamily
MNPNDSIVMNAATAATKQSPHWSVRLRNELQQIEPLGSFVHQTILTNIPYMKPHVTIEGVGRLGFPILDVDKLIAVSTKAPFGRLDKTLFDETIRSAWQIDASKITITDKQEVWTTYFNDQVQHCCFHLGISKERFETSNIEANLYKMLIYEKGGHFAPHRDTEKEVGMFGTLIIQLPTSEGFTGGTLTVTHGGESKTINISGGNDEEFHAIAFYADCQHQLHPITNGKRVCLVYNLVALPQETTCIPSHAINIETEANLRMIVDEWTRNTKKIKKIGYQLEHKYTHQSICFSALKGRDEIVLTTLRNATDSNGERLFCISILLMEHYCEMTGEDEGDRHMTPFKLIEENADGSFEKTRVTNDKDWNMECYSMNGWWVMPGVLVKDGDILPDDADAMKCQRDFDDNAEGNDDMNNDDDSSVYDDDGNKIDRNKQMYLTCCHSVTQEHEDYGNDGGYIETWYYAAAIILSPYTH